jgi:putative membrane protein
MRLVAKSLIGLIALLHLYIAWFEIFAWESRGPNIFTTFPADLFAQTVDMAANQGIYNAFLAAGLIWALTIKDVKWHVNVATCFLLFVGVAGLFGAATVTVKTLMIQTVPAAIALILLRLGNRSS